MKGLAKIIALLVVTAWQYRYKNRPIFFVLMGTLFGVVAILTSDAARRNPSSFSSGMGFMHVVCRRFWSRRSGYLPSAKEGKAPTIVRVIVGNEERLRPALGTIEAKRIGEGWKGSPYRYFIGR